MSECLHNDVDQREIKEWMQAIESVIREEGIERAQFIINRTIQHARKNFFNFTLCTMVSNYVNTIGVEKEPEYPGNLEIERSIRSAIRWNAIITVLRASKKNLDLGGHIASFQSFSTFYEVCFHHFFRARNEKDGGDLVYFQGHISPGIYARAFIEGRITEEKMNLFRQEVYEMGLSSYPHPKMMPEFWQFPTVSMGIGPINAIYQAKFLKYLEHRCIKDTSEQTVYAFLGDGEMDEPESKGAITIATREKLNNLVFIINCNLQRLDGPVHGNGKIINELEDIFYGAGWKVLKVIWGGLWDPLLRKDISGKLVKLMNETLDGDYQNLKSKDGSYIRKNFFGRYHETANLVKEMTDNEIWALNRGGHDPKKIFSALKKTKKQKKPTVILSHTIKGYGLGETAEGKNIAHQVKKMNIADIYSFRDRFHVPVSNIDIEKLPYITFKKNSEEYQYLHKRRKALKGYLPTRIKDCTKNIPILELGDFLSIIEEQKKEISTTTAFVRALNVMLKNKSIKDYLVPIIADEARTFGMEGLFRQIGIYNPHGQKYTPQDRHQVAYYKEDEKGQILQEGINELGAASSWLAAATSYSTNDFPMIPFYIYYSIFGFQRIGDLFWAAGDQQARGFLIGATSGRTTLNGEGLQHEDGHSHIQSLTIPNCISYDPAYAYEVAVILHDGLVRMYGEKKENIYYYITTMNENYHMPAMPHGVEEGIRKGIYMLETIKDQGKGKVQLLGSGAIFRHVREAAIILEKEYGIGSYVFSVTSFTELARDGQDCERWNMLHPMEEPRIPYVAKILSNMPTVASTDYMKLFAEQIRNFLPTKDYHVLGTDGFGRSGSRENLRNYFEVNAFYIVVATLALLAKRGLFEKKWVVDAIVKFHIDADKVNPRIS